MIGEVSDREFKRFLFKVSLPIFFFVLLKNGNEIIRGLCGYGSIQSFITLSVGFPLIIVYCIHLKTYEAKEKD